MPPAPARHFSGHDRTPSAGRSAILCAAARSPDHIRHQYIQNRRTIMTTVAAYGTNGPTEDLVAMRIDRREPDAADVDIEILYCGVCHSDLHSARNDWGFSLYPLVPGHEIVGRVARVGAEVSRYKPGDLVAVGCLVDSCRTCPSCEEDLEQYCHGGMVGTYGSPDPRHGNAVTFGGYSQRIVVNENFVLRIPPNLDIKAAAPLLCAGITTWSPLRHWNVG